MDFDLPSDLIELQQHVRRFIAEQIIPMESDYRRSAGGPEDGLRRDLIDKARKAKLLTPQAPEEFGGLELSHLGKAVVLEESGYSLLGPIAMNCAAPDEGNMHLMDMVGTDKQKER